MKALDQIFKEETFVHVVITKDFIESKRDSGWKGSQKASQDKLFVIAEFTTRSRALPYV